jgi:A/G-specific adenine glycosylase
MNQWFADKIKAWYQQNKRELPWRTTKDPYKIWLSEVILKQTRVEQGTKYYLAFIDAFPTVKDLAKAKEDKVLKLWQGLGYYSRARNLHTSAKYIVNTLHGKFPEKYDDLIQLKGVGIYTASAIASFAYNEAKAVVDGNVYRVLSRVFGIETPIDSHNGQKIFQRLANELLNKKNAAIHNQAIMEFGSQFCTANKPNCQQCIFSNKCLAFSQNTVNELPRKEKKIKVSKRHFTYLIMLDKKDKILLNKRLGKDIWKGLYDFPLIEKEKELSEATLFKSIEFKSQTNNKAAVLYISKMYKHVLSHQIIYAKFIVLKLNQSHKKETITANTKTLTKFAYPRLIDIFLKDCNLNDFF